MAQATAPAFLLGSFVDDYDNRYAISADVWLQHPGTRYHVTEWNPAERYLIARNAGNDAGNDSNTYLWTRIDWVELDGMAPYSWAFCYSAFDAPSAAAAEATRVARPETPRTGCNGYPYSRMRRADSLTFDVVANAGVLVTDGVTSLLVDLPYEPGAYGYDVYDVTALNPPGRVVSVITHDHTDHFERDAFLARTDWQLIADPALTSGIPDARVISANPDGSYTVGAFNVTAIPTPHSDGHRSYRVEWGDRAFYFTGDTQDTTALSAEPGGDVLFVTPWLYCSLAGSPVLDAWEDVVLYHVRSDESDDTPACR